MNKAKQPTPAQERKQVARARKFAAGARSLATVPHPADCPRPGQTWFDRLTDEVLTVKCLAVQEAVVSWTVVCETAGGVLLSFALAGWFRKILMPGTAVQGKVPRFIPWPKTRIRLDVGTVTTTVTVRKKTTVKKNKKKGTT